MAKTQIDICILCLRQKYVVCLMDKLRFIQLEGWHEVLHPLTGQKQMELARLHVRERLLPLVIKLINKAVDEAGKANIKEKKRIG